jgi:ATP-dependent DNA helicase RecG
LLKKLPFKLTGAQQKVWKEIAHDLAQAHPMQRLLLGDVGSGKTIVAALAALQAIENGYQVAFMAPTEILAEQHYLKLSEWLVPLGITPVWLSGSLKKKEKTAAAERIADGDTLLAIGTHALFQASVEFNKLGLVIVDEQHKFGVQQRLSLRNKGDEPHQLMMSATPIPRTLAMSYYADLDVSVIDELPPGRTPIVTKLVSDARRDEVFERVRAACMAGRQAYWVCPLIEKSDALEVELQNAIETHQQLTEALPELKVGLAHGRLPPAEKAAVMAAFKASELHLLVATTVIEVGVDVPNASLMVIDHAERMGLAQLHQLRGRVGRGAAESMCVLLFMQPLSELARERLKVIYENTDGFVIAQQDLQLRGPGELLGARQSGVAMLRFADLTEDEDLLEQARLSADELLRNAPEVARAHLQRWMANKHDFLQV